MSRGRYLRINANRSREPFEIMDVAVLQKLFEPFPSGGVGPMDNDQALTWDWKTSQHPKGQGWVQNGTITLARGTDVDWNDITALVHTRSEDGEYHLREATVVTLHLGPRVVEVGAEFHVPPGHTVCYYAIGLRSREWIRVGEPRVMELPARPRGPTLQMGGVKFAASDVTISVGDGANIEQVEYLAGYKIHNAKQVHTIKSRAPGAVHTVPIEFTVEMELTSPPGAFEEFMEACAKGGDDDDSGTA